MKLSSTLCAISAAVSCHAQAGRLHQEPLSTSAAHLSLTHDLISFHQNLTQIESITGNEKQVGEWLVSSLESQGYNVEKQQVSADPERFNVLAWPGKQRDAKVLLSSHIDTVPPFYPYHHKDSATNQTISGRGSVDAKGSVATQILAANELLSQHELSPDDIAMLYVVGEETGGDGMRAANSLGLRPQTIIFGEPTEGKLASGHKGNLAVVLTAKGKAAHSGYPWLGRSANEVLVKALAALMELGQKLPESDKYGVTTFNLGRIEGGVAANVVAQDAMANIAVRIAEGTPAFIKKEIVKAVHSAVKSFLDDDMEAEDVIGLEFPSAGYAPVDIDSDVPGFEVITVNYGTDIPNLNQTVDGQKRYLYGPGSILVAHSDHEMLTEAQLFDAVGGYKKLIRHALGH
ncbi:Zn-dependent exopeptidase [Hortaea werneckii]|nr:Zn-dependent exopeptidase [Hortaea werneckii]